MSSSSALKRQKKYRSAPPFQRATVNATTPKLFTASIRRPSRSSVSRTIWKADTSRNCANSLASARWAHSVAGCGPQPPPHAPPTAIAVNDGSNPASTGGVYHRWERRALAAADGVITTSRMLADRLGRADRADTAVIPYPVAPIPTSGPRETGDDDVECVLFVGTVQPRKGVDVWVRSLDRVLRARPRARAEIIGPDTHTAPDGGSMIEFARSRLDPPLRPRLRWRGACSHGVVLRAIRAAAAVVVPSRLDAFSLAAAEAIMLERPLVVTRAVGLCEVLPELPAVPVDDADALADAQISALADPAGAVALARDFRTLLIRRTDPVVHLERRAAFVRGLAAASRPAGSDAMDRKDAMDRMDQYLHAVETVERGTRGSLIEITRVATRRVRHSA